MCQVAGSIGPIPPGKHEITVARQLHLTRTGPADEVTSGGASFVTMVQAADFQECDHVIGDAGDGVGEAAQSGTDRIPSPDGRARATSNVWMMELTPRSRGGCEQFVDHVRDVHRGPCHTSW